MIKNNLEVIKSTEILGKRFKVFGTPEYPLFKASDVASWIEHSNPRMMLQNIDEDEKVVRNVYTRGGSQETWFVTEYGLYEILMLSRKPIAKEFKKKVKEILKSLRVTGIYINNGDLILETYCSNYSKEKIATITDFISDVEHQQQRMAELYAKAELYDNLISGKGFYNMEAVAKLLGIGRNTLIKELKLRDILNEKNLPYQKYMKHFKITCGATECGFNYTITLVKPSGLKFIMDTLKN